MPREHFITINALYLHIHARDTPSNPHMQKINAALTFIAVHLQLDCIRKWAGHMLTSITLEGWGLLSLDAYVLAKLKLIFF